jgi:hypothetical protein
MIVEVESKSVYADVGNGGIPFSLGHTMETEVFRRPYILRVNKWSVYNAQKRPLPTNVNFNHSIPSKTPTGIISQCLVRVDWVAIDPHVLDFISLNYLCILP